MLIDVAISGDRNVIKKEAEKILKYKDLTIQIQRMWNVKNKSDTSNNRGNLNHLKIYSENTSATHRQSTTSRNYSKQPYWALHTYCGKC
jgi:hypothetical protein